MRSLGDLTGQKFNYLLVLSFNKKENMMKFWNVRCECGNELVVRQGNLKSGNTISCGCYHKKVINKPRYDLLGMKFNRLTVVSYYGRIKNHTRWNVICDCGKEAIVDAYDLKNNKTVSCGCYNEEKKIRHGYARDSGTVSEYSIWEAMKGRCCNKNNAMFSRYGGRGISVCDRWKHSFVNFLEDMGSRPSAKHSIDRIDNDGNYEPSNCRWATMKEQSRNMSRNRWVDYNGVRMVIKDWATELGIDSRQLYTSLKTKTLQDVIDARGLKLNNNQHGIRI